MGSSIFKIAGVLAANDPDLSLGPRTLRSSLAIEVMKASLCCKTDEWDAKCLDNLYVLLFE